MAKGAGKSNGKGTRGSRKRRGQSESMTGAKEAAAEVRKGELELKPVEINDGDFDLHFRSVKSATEKMTTAQGLLRSCLKAAKKVSEQLHDAVKYAMKAERADAEEIKRELEVMGYVLKKTGAPIQITLHDTLLGDATESAYRRGFQAGETGKPLANPYPAASDLAAEFSRGWQNGQAKLMGVNVDEAGPDDEGADDNTDDDAAIGDEESDKRIEEPALA